LRVALVWFAVPTLACRPYLVRSTYDSRLLSRVLVFAFSLKTFKPAFAIGGLFSASSTSRLNFLESKRPRSPQVILDLSRDSPGSLQSELSLAEFRAHYFHMNSFQMIIRCCPIFSVILMLHLEGGKRSCASSKTSFHRSWSFSGIRMEYYPNSVFVSNSAGHFLDYCWTDRGRRRQAGRFECLRWYEGPCKRFN